MQSLLIFTDLNDTLLDAKYDFSAAGEALAVIRRQGIPLIITTSKTRWQAEIYRRALGLNYPLIVENGGAIHFPPGSFEADELPKECVFDSGEWEWELGRGVQEILPDLLLAARTAGAEIETIWEMTEERISEYTGMSRAEAEACQERRYCVYFLIHRGKEELLKQLRQHDYQPAKGSYFYHLSDRSKGEAVKRLTELYKVRHGASLKTVAIGDNENDLSMLKAVDIPCLVEQPGGGYNALVEIEGMRLLPGVGPKGWNEGVKELLMSIKV